MPAELMPAACNGHPPLLTDFHFVLLKPVLLSLQVKLNPVVTTAHETINLGLLHTHRGAYLNLGVTDADPQGLASAAANQLIGRYHDRARSAVSSCSIRLSICGCSCGSERRA